MATKKVAKKVVKVVSKAVPAKKPASKKPAAKPVPAKKASAKSAKKPVPKAAPAKKAPAKKPLPKKVVAKKPTAKSAPAKKASAKKPAAKPAPAKKAAVKPAKKPAPAKKAVAKKPVAKPSPAKKVPAKKPSPAKKPVAKPVAKKPAAKPVAKVAEKPVAKPASAPKAPPVRKFPPLPLPFGGNLPLPAPTTWDPKKRPAANEKPLTEAELREFRKLVEEAGRKMQENLDALTRDNLRRADQEGEMVTDTSAHATHSADHGTDNFDREIALNLACGRQEELTLIRDALHRIDEGTYGICEVCGKPIGRARLKAKPYARLCILCKSDAEKGVPKYRPLSKGASVPTTPPEAPERDEGAPADE